MAPRSAAALPPRHPALRARARSRTSAADVFTELAWLWAEHDRGRSEALSLAARRVVNVARAGGDVLDVGCGPGSLLARVVSEARDTGKPIGRLVGVDVAPGMAAVAGARRGVEAFVAEAGALAFPDQTFDVVTSGQALHFVDDPVRAVREMCRVALPGGTLVLEVKASGTQRAYARRVASRLPARSLLRRYLEVPRTYRVAGILSELDRLGCDVRRASVGREGPGRARLLAKVARWSGTAADRAVARELERDGWRGAQTECIVARVPGPRTGAMPVHVHGLEGWNAQRVKDLLADLPKARGYHVVVKPLRYRTRPHVQAFCEFDHRRITIQVPVPFRSFHEDVPYRAERIGAKGFRFRWFSRRLRFERPDELIRYLYLHEYYHWYLREVVGRQTAAAETACDRFALSRL